MLLKYKKKMILKCMKLKCIQTWNICVNIMADLILFRFNIFISRNGYIETIFSYPTDISSIFVLVWWISNCSKSVTPWRHCISCVALVSLDCTLEMYIWCDFSPLYGCLKWHKFDCEVETIFFFTFFIYLNTAALLFMNNNLNECVQIKH